MADLHDELAVIGNFEDVGILLAVAADPDIALESTWMPWFDCGHS